MTDEVDAYVDRDGKTVTCHREWVVCPVCNHMHGDGWEWCADTSGQDLKCDGCGTLLRCWPEYEVTYYAKVK